MLSSTDKPIARYTHRSSLRLLHGALLTLLLPLSASMVQAQPAHTRSLPHAEVSQDVRKLARACMLPNVNHGTVECLMHKFGHLRAKGFRHDQVFALDPGSKDAKRFYKALERYADKKGMAIVGMGIVEEYNHAFCFAPVTRDGLGGKVMQMDATDPMLGTFGPGRKTRAKDAFGDKAFTNQARALWLVPKEAAITAGNAKYDVVKDKVCQGVNCAEFSTGLLHHLNKLGVEEFKDFYAAHKAVVNPTGPKHHRGFAAGLELAVPHIIVQHTNQEWQQHATDPKNGASKQNYNDGKQQVRALQTGPMELPIKHQDFEL